MFDAAQAVRSSEWEAYVTTVIQVERTVHTAVGTTGLWKTSSETSFYLSNRPIDAETAAQAIRKHWGIENKLHYVRDVTLGEDASRIRKNPGVFARIRSFAYNILRFNQSGSIAQTRFKAALGGLNALSSMNYCGKR